MKIKYYEIYKRLNENNYTVTPTTELFNCKPVELISVVENIRVAEHFCQTHNKVGEEPRYFYEEIRAECFNTCEDDECIENPDKKTETSTGEKPDPSNIYYNEITENNIKEKLSKSIYAVREMRRNTTGANANLRLIQQVLEHYRTKANEIDNYSKFLNSCSDYKNDESIEDRDSKIAYLESQVRELVSLLYTCNFEDLLVNQYGECVGYAWNGFIHYDENRIDAEERFSILNDILTIRRDDE